jgi:hypothetical protein
MAIYNNPNNPIDLGDVSDSLTVDAYQGTNQIANVINAKAECTITVTSIPAENAEITLVDSAGDPWTYQFDYDNNPGGAQSIQCKEAGEFVTTTELENRIAEVINSHGKFLAYFQATTLIIQQLVGGVIGNTVNTGVTGCTVGNFEGGTTDLSVYLTGGDPGSNIKLILKNMDNDVSIDATFSVGEGFILYTGVDTGVVSVGDLHILEINFVKLEGNTWGCSSQHLYNTD